MRIAEENAKKKKKKKKKLSSPIHLFLQHAFVRFAKVKQLIMWKFYFMELHDDQFS